MDDHFDVCAVFRADGLHGLEVANVNGFVAVALEFLFQHRPGGCSGRLGTKKICPHVVVYADDFEPFSMESFARFGTYQAGRAGN